MEITQYSIKYRPLYFDELHGQNRVRDDLIRRAKTKNWPKAMLLQGPYGTGKTTSAHLIARALQCSRPSEDGSPCNECPSCRSILDERFDRDTVMLDGAVLSQKDKVIDFTSTISISPMYDPNRVFIIEESDQLSSGAINALLKILEGKRPNVHFILLSMVNGGIPPAIKSRCQLFSFNSVGVKETMYFLKNILEKDSKWDDLPESFKLEGLGTIASLSKGSLRDAIQLLETCIQGEHFTKEQIEDLTSSVDEVATYKILEGLLNLSKEESLWNSIYKVDPSELYHYLSLVITDVMAYKITGFLKDERFGGSTKKMASNPNVDDLFKILTEYPHFSKGFIRKADIVGAFLHFYMEREVTSTVPQRKIPTRSIRK